MRNRAGHVDGEGIWGDISDGAHAGERLEPNEHDRERWAASGGDGRLLKVAGEGVSSGLGQKRHGEAWARGLDSPRSNRRPSTGAPRPQPTLPPRPAPTLAIEA